MTTAICPKCQNESVRFSSNLKDNRVENIIEKCNVLICGYQPLTLDELN